MAETSAAQRQFDAAEREYRKALELRPDLRGVHLAIGLLKVAAGNLDDAEKEFRAEAAVTPGDGEAAWRLGSVLLQKGRTRDALAELQRSDRLRPKMIETLFDLGKAYSMDNQPAEAEKAWLNVLAIEDAGKWPPARIFSSRNTIEGWAGRRRRTGISGAFRSCSRRSRGSRLLLGLGGIFAVPRRAGAGGAHEEFASVGEGVRSAAIGAQRTVLGLITIHHNGGSIRQRSFR